MRAEDWPPARAERWQPGDPLHLRPRGTAYGQQHVRPMISLVSDERPLIQDSPGYCASCEVVGRLLACWYCGEPTALAELEVAKALAEGLPG